MTEMNTQLIIDLTVYAALLLVGLLVGWLLRSRRTAVLSANSNAVNRFEGVMVGWQRITRAAERTLLDNVAATTPWLAPVIPAAIAYRHMVDHLLFGEWLAGIGALVIEFLGLAAVHTAFQLWEWNEIKNESEQAAPFGWSVGAAGFYLLIVVTVNVMLETAANVTWLPMDAARITSKALLSLLSIDAAFVLALRSQHGRRLAVKQETTAKRQQAAELGKLRKAVETLRQERDEFGRQVTELSRMNKALQNDVKVLGKQHETFQKLSSNGHNLNGNLPKVTRPSNESFTHWRTIPDKDKLRFASMTPEEILQENPTISDRTAQNWHENAQKLAGKVSRNTDAN